MRLTDALRPILQPVCRVAFRPEVHGAANVPTSGPVILAANHLSFVDSFLIPLMTPRRVSFLAKEEYFDRGGPRRWLVRSFMTGLDAIPVPRAGYRSAQEALETALRVLKDGEAFGIHPEGSRSRDGRLYRGHTGVGWLALASGAPVVPVAILGTDRVQPVGARLPRPGRVVVRFGRPLLFSPPPEGRQSVVRRAVTDEIMQAIAALSGQPEAEEYNQHSHGKSG